MARSQHRRTAAEPIDSALFDRMARAAGIQLRQADRKALSELLAYYNALPALRYEYITRYRIARGRGRPSAANLHALAVGLLFVLERAGGRITAHSPRSNPNVTAGGAANFLRAAWKALDDPAISQDGFARLVIRAWRAPRSRARQARERALEAQRNAWKG